jgi:hypothetical protein
MFYRFALLERADAILAVPPEITRIERPTWCGDRVARFVLPLDLCKPQNRKRDTPSWAAKKHLDAVTQAMAIQVRPWSRCLPGRPQVRCTRFSSSEPDSFADWAKVPVDVLCAPIARNKNRLNIIRDDSPRFADIKQWWEPAKPGDGFVYIAVWTGKVEA